MDDRDFVDLLKFSTRQPRQQRVPLPPGQRSQFPLASRRSYGLSTSNRPQRATVKVNYATPDLLKKHASYLERDGKGLDGKKPELFTEQGKDLPTGEISGEKRFFRLVLSPENSNQLSDMQQYTRDFMKKANEQLTSDLNRPAGELQWFAAVHYNTANPHSHIVIRGLDSKNKEVILSRNFITIEARKIASDRATLELGPRTREEIGAQVARELVSDRFTAIDRSIYITATKSGLVVPLDPLQKERLDHLERKMNLAHKTKANNYQLDPHWKERLEYNGRKQDIVRTIYNDLPPDIKKQWTARGTDKHLTIYRNSWIIQGKITSAGIVNELTDRPYVVIESKGKPYYYSNPKIDLAAHQPGHQVKLDRGKLVSLGKEKNLGNEISPSGAPAHQSKTPSLPKDHRRDRGMEL